MPATVQYEGDAQPVQGNVHEELVEGPVEESGVDRYNWMNSPGGQASGRDGSVLLSDAHVEDPLGELLGERRQANRMQHGCRDGHDVLTLTSQGEHLFAEYRSPVSAGGLQRQTGVRMDRAHSVEAVLVAPLGGAVATALLGEAVDDDGSAEVTSLLQGGFQGGDVVAIDGTDVRQPQILEHRGCRRKVYGSSAAVGGTGERPPRDAAAVCLVHAVPRGAKSGQMAGEAAYGR